MKYEFNLKRSLLNDLQSNRDDSQFLSAVAWRPRSTTLLAANSQGIIKVLSLAWCLPLYHLIYWIHLFINAVSLPTLCIILALYNTFSFRCCLHLETKSILQKSFIPGPKYNIPTDTSIIFLSSERSTESGKWISTKNGLLSRPEILCAFLWENLIIKATHLQIKRIENK